MKRSILGNRLKDTGFLAYYTKHASMEFTARAGLRRCDDRSQVDIFSRHL